jgi:hypothetical protein
VTLGHLDLDLQAHAPARVGLDFLHVAQQGVPVDPHCEREIDLGVGRRVDKLDLERGCILG